VGCVVGGHVTDFFAVLPDLDPVRSDPDPVGNDLVGNDPSGIDLLFPAGRGNG
jgi:hypothetical protein